MSKSAKPAPTPTPTPSTAEALLRAADSGRGMGDRIARRTAWRDGVYAIVLGLLIATFLLAVKYAFPIGRLWLDLVIVAAYGMGVILLVLWTQRRRRASRPGWQARYGAGFALTMAFYAIGVALANPTEPGSLAFWIPYALLTAAPLVIAALWNRAARAGEK